MCQPKHAKPDRPHVEGLNPVHEQLTLLDERVKLARAGLGQQIAIGVGMLNLQSA
jgi:hypothetical protein